MSQKVLIGAAVLAGGAYLYDQNVSPIFTREKVQAKYELKKLENQSKDFGSKLTDTLEDTKKDISKKTSEYKKSIEQSDLYNSLKDKTDNFQNQAKQYRYDVKDATTPESEKNFLVRGVHSYIAKVNEIGGSAEEKTKYSTMSPRVELKEQKSWWDSWFGEKEREAERYGQQIKNDAEQTKNSWLNWGSQKADEAERSLDKEANVARSDYYKTKSSAEGAYNDAKRSAEGAYNDARRSAEGTYNDVKRSAEGTYNDVKRDAQKYGSAAYNEGRDIAIRAYQVAREEYDDLSSSLNSADKQRNLEKAKQNINAALNNLKAYGDDVVNDVNRKFK